MSTHLPGQWVAGPGSHPPGPQSSAKQSTAREPCGGGETPSGTIPVERAVGTGPCTQAASVQQLAQWSTHGISSGRTSARMLMESVLALEVGAAASRILSRAIWEAEKEANHPIHPLSKVVLLLHSSLRYEHVLKPFSELLPQRPRGTSHAASSWLFPRGRAVGVVHKRGGISSTPPYSPGLSALSCRQFRGVLAPT